MSGMLSVNSVWRMLRFALTVLKIVPGRHKEKEASAVEELKEILPFLIPLVIAQFALLGYALVHIMNHKHYKRGTRAVWLVITLVMMNFVGPILYFLFGKEDV